MPGILSFTAGMREAFEKLNKEQVEALRDDGDVVTCTSGFDNDGSTGFEIFANGFELAERAAGRPVYGHDVEDGDDEAFGGTTFCLIGTPEEIVAKIERVSADNPSEGP
jgi:alkanesulfonate monooxygenase SsuD/methylene tetrahydromethanopterin reductase-like flavin-dependent oxidoreductase (luciferase family)